MQSIGLALLLRYKQLSLCYQTTSLMQSIGLAPSGGIDTGVFGNGMHKQLIHLLSFVISARNVAITKNICLGGGGGDVSYGRQLGPKVSHLEA